MDLPIKNGNRLHLYSLRKRLENPGQPSQPKEELSQTGTHIVPAQPVHWKRGTKMFFSNNEKQIMEKLFLSINNHANQIYILTYSNGDIVEAQVYTCYETDNGLEDMKSIMPVQ